MSKIHAEKSASMRGAEVLQGRLKKVDQLFMMTMAAYNLVRIRTLGQVRLQGAQ